MKSCANQKQNLVNCNCSYEPCARKGICCECLLYHRKEGQLPACFFPPQVEKTYDRSIENFIVLNEPSGSFSTRRAHPEARRAEGSPEILQPLRYAQGPQDDGSNKKKHPDPSNK